MLINLLLFTILSLRGAAHKEAELVPPENPVMVEKMQVDYQEAAVGIAFASQSRQKKNSMETPLSFTSTNEALFEILNLTGPSR